MKFQLGSPMVSIVTDFCSWMEFAYVALHVYLPACCSCRELKNKDKLLSWSNSVYIGGFEWPGVLRGIIKSHCYYDKVFTAAFTTIPTTITHYVTRWWRWWRQVRDVCRCECAALQSEHGGIGSMFRADRRFLNDQPLDARVAHRVVWYMVRTSVWKGIDSSCKSELNQRWPTGGNLPPHSLLALPPPLRHDTRIIYYQS